MSFGRRSRKRISLPPSRLARTDPACLWEGSGLLSNSTAPAQDGGAGAGAVTAILRGRSFPGVQLTDALVQGRPGHAQVPGDVMAGSPASMRRPVLLRRPPRSFPAARRLETGSWMRSLLISISVGPGPP